MSRLTRGGGPYIFYDLLGRLQDLDLHLLAPQAALELLDPGLRRAQETGRDDILVGGHGGGREKKEDSGEGCGADPTGSAPENRARERKGQNARRRENC